MISSIRFSTLMIVASMGLAAPAAAQTVFVYQHTKTPAAGLRITQSVDGKDVSVTTDASGRATLAPREKARIEDPAADNIVLLGVMVGAQPPAQVVVPEAVRISGRLTVDRPDQVRLQVGFGPRLTAGQLFRGDYDRALVESEAENRPFGLELPRSPRIWRSVPVTPDRTFSTPWFPVVDAPQLVAVTSDGLAAVEDVALAGIQPHATLQAPDLRFVQTKTLTVNFPVPRNRAVATNAQVFMRGARWRPEDAAFIARYLSALEHLEAVAFTFSTSMRPFNIGPGDSTLRLLPPFTSIDLRLMGAVSDRSADITVPLPEITTSITADATQILPRAAKTLPLAGTVVFDRTLAAVKDATVVYSCYPAKVETKTDEHGNFVIPEACVGRELTLFVSAADPSTPPRFAPAQRKYTMVHSAGAVKRVVITLPERNLPLAANQKPPSLPPLVKTPSAATRVARTRVPFPKNLNQLGDDYEGDPPLIVYEDSMDGERLIEVEDATWHSVVNGQVYVTVAETGTFRVRGAYTPCLEGDNSDTNFTAHQATQVQLVPSGSDKPVVRLTVFWPNSSAPVPQGTAIYFPSQADEPDPIEIDADAQGVVTLTGCWSNFINVFVAAEGIGYFNGSVLIDFRGYGTVFLDRTPPWDGDTVSGGGSSAPRRK